MNRQLLLNIATSLATRFPWIRRSPEPIKRVFRSVFPQATTDPAPAELTDTGNPDEYGSRLAREREIFANQTEVNDLPPIFHYWSNKYLRPMLEQFGFSNPDQFFAHFLEKCCRENTGHPIQIVSVGAGNCDTEVRVARLLLERGINDFTLTCLDLNEDMLGRGQDLAREQGVEKQIKAMRTDFNEWKPAVDSLAAVMANQSLHHVVGLEGLFESIEKGLTADGRFLTADMIGRNGHMRWPEAMEIVHEFWKELPASYRWNVQLNRHEELHEYWDCSNEGFEGIRAQEILPLLIERFEFEFFLPFGNVIDPFIDRAFGVHFNVESERDLALIDRIHYRDTNEILAGRIKPTHLFAAMRKRPYSGPRNHIEGLTPEFCVRKVH